LSGNLSLIAAIFRGIAAAIQGSEICHS